MSSEQLTSSLPVLDCKPDHNDYRITTNIGNYMNSLKPLIVTAVENSADSE